jgi:hydrogenase 3 maturation protease
MSEGMLSDLKELISHQEKKILFVGIGNLLKSDDGAGVYISRKIKNSNHISSLTVEVSIENYIGKINSLNPDILILIDCVDMKAPAGTCKFLPLEAVHDMTFNTHNISLNRLSEFFTMPVYLVGIQPQKIDFGENISYIVMNVSDKIIEVINKQEVHYGY